MILDWLSGMIGNTGSAPEALVAGAVVLAIVLIANGIAALWRCVEFIPRGGK